MAKTKGLRLKQKAAQAADVVEQIGMEETADTLKSAVDIVKEEYGDFKLSKSMKKQLAKELGETEETVDGWQVVSDVLDHIDITALAKKHPEAIGKIANTVISVLSLFYPIVGTVGSQMSREFITKLVEFAGLLTPEHIANIIVKKQIERKQRKQSELPEAEAAENLPELAEESDESAELSEEAADELVELSDEAADEPVEVSPDNVEIVDAPEAPPKQNVFGAIKQKVADGGRAVAKGSKKVVSGGKKGVEKIAGVFRKKPESEDVFESIRKLAALKECGAITDEEFEAKKAELLARI